MKKILLLLFVPISLLAQFEDEYFIFTNENEFNNVSYLIDLNISNNTINQQIELTSESGSNFQISNGILLTYFPNSQFLLGGFLDHLFSEEPSGSYYLYKLNNAGFVDTELGIIGGYWTVDAGMSSAININGIAGISQSENNMEIYSYSSFYNSLDPSQDNKSINKLKLTLNENGDYDIDLQIIKDITNSETFKGLAYDRLANNLYFMGLNNQNQPKFYKISINDNQLTELNSDFGNSPCCEYALHFLQGQNKIMMADFNSGDFYTYDLNTNLVELYAETDLKYITGIVNKDDFLGNIEVYNQGEIKIYPNPVRENLHIESSHQIEKIELFNIIGQEQVEFNSNEKILSFTNQPKGIYILKIQLKNGKIETKKIIKN